MPRITMTAKAVENLKAPAAGRVEYFDAALPGLYLRITHRDVRSWGLFYRLDGALIRQTIGRWPAMGLGAARTAAGAILDKLERGDDPRAEAEAKRQAAKLARAKTFEAAVEDFNTRYLDKRRSGPERHAALKRVFVPKWGKQPVGAITRADVLAALDEIEDAGKPYARNRALANIRKFFNWCLERGLVDANPASRIGLLPEAKRERVLSDDELRAVWGALDAEGYPWGPFGKLLVLTGQRRDEVATIERPDLDLKRKLWTIPGAKTKNGQPHTVPLSPAAVDIVEALPKWEGDYLFSTKSGKRPISGFAKTKERLDKASGVKEWRLHDLRRTVATRMGGLGIDRFIIARVLNHTDSTVTGGYDRHMYDKEKRRALERWAAALHRVLVEKKGAAVVQLPVRTANPAE